MGYYGDWSIEEARDVGVRHMARCKTNNGYEGRLTVGREYEIEITPRIMPMSPLCRFVGDGGKEGECHLERFEKIKGSVPCPT